MDLKRTDVKSHCPINFTLEAVGDSWSLLILRDIMYSGKHTFKDFFDSEERITSSVLADRLSHLVKNEVLIKEPSPADKRSAAYVFTEKGLGLIPILLDMMEWGTTQDPQSLGHEKKDFVARIRKEQSALCREVQNKIRNGGSVFGFEK